MPPELGGATVCLLILAIPAILAGTGPDHAASMSPSLSARILERMDKLEAAVDEERAESMRERERWETEREALQQKII